MSTFPTSSYDLGEVLTQLGIGEAIVTVMNEKGAPTPVAWTRLRAPQSLMAPASAEQLTASVQASPNNAKYTAVIDRESAYEMLAAKVQAGAEQAQAEERAKQPEAPEAARPEAGEVRGRGGHRLDGLQAVRPLRRPRDRPRDLRRGPPPQVNPAQAGNSVV